MIEYESRDLVCLHLDAHADAHERSPAPQAVTAVGIGDALELGDTAASRVRLLEDLTALQEDGFVVAEERPVVGYDVPRTIYLLTETGRDHATMLRNRFRSETVEITNGAIEEVPLAEIDRYFKDTDAPLVKALARLTDDGRVPLEQHAGETIVDREQSLETVQEAIEASFSRESRTVVVGGAAGMGKTAIVKEAIARVANDWTDLLKARGDCHPEPTTSYEPFRQIFEYFPNSSDLLARVTDAREADTPDTPRQIDAQRTALFNNIADGLREAATIQPVVVFLDNLQWADNATLQLFAHLATTIDELVYPVAFVGTYREPVVAATDAHPLTNILTRIEQAGTYSEVTLESLEQADTRALLADVIGRQRLPEPFVEFVHEQSGGNPLFVREIATHLLEMGRIDPDQDAYPTSPREIVLPEEVTEQIDRRLSALDEPSRELLQVGAVLGERISGRILVEATDLVPAQRREYTDILIASRLWEPAGGEVDAATGAAAAERITADGSGNFRFVSGSVREAIVERLPEEEACEYHARVAEAFTSVYGDDLDEQAARVAHHYEQAGEIEPAVEYYQRAGDHAKDTYASEEAIEHYERAVALNTDVNAIDSAELAGVRRKLASVYATIGDLESAIETAEEGLTVAPDSSRERCRLLDVMARVRIYQGAYEQAHELALRQRDLAAELDAHDLQAQAIGRLGSVSKQQGEYDQARDYHERSLEIAQDIGNRYSEAASLNNLGNVAQAQDEYDQAREYLEKSLDIAQDIGNQYGEALSLNNLGNVAQAQDEYDQARDYYERSLDILRDIGSQHAKAAIFINLGEVAQAQDEYDQARDYYERSLDILRDIGSRHEEAISLNNLGEIARTQGEYDQAREHWRAALEIFEAIGAPQEALRTLQHLVETCRRQGDDDRALEWCHRAQAMLTDASDAVANQHREWINRYTSKFES